MASPPPFAVSSTRSLPRAWFAGSGNVSYPIASQPTGAHFTFARGLPDTTGPTLGFRSAATVTSDLAGPRVPASQQFSFYHDGAAIELHFQNNSKGVLVKIDGQYLSLDPITTDGEQYIRIDFASRDVRRIDLVSYKSAFAGVWTGTGDGIWAAPARGPRAICMGDSFTTAAPTGWTNWFADAMGWDDVWTSGIGGTGYVANASGLSPNWNERLEADVIAYRPEVVFLFGSVNDMSYGPQAVGAGVRSLVSRLRKALPDCVVAGGMNTAFGVEAWPSESWDVLDAAKAAFTEAGGAWMSLLEMPMEFSGPAVGNAGMLMDNLAAGRAGNTGTPTAVDASAGFRVNTSSSTPDTNLRIGATVEIGSGATRERVVVTAVGLSGGKQIYGFDGALRYAHAAGEPVREVGPAYITGRGTSVAPSGWGTGDIYVGDDGYHPNDHGHRMIGMLNASMLKRHLRSTGRA
ncbi:SGNH/GDSL hydrolase family protein [Erythrobacter sp. HKB08]|uniref:SGNH/GDSL hydrolase family protein n=1 Tax=Erythrobacter sp. HKB08 TaxID=2502843 RepID=UPI0013E8F4DF|nr:SGNH/GDSL hydrolase family protein [Erythrobacter sp. HKB08]